LKIFVGTTRRELRRGGALIAYSRSFDLLEVLDPQRERVVSRRLLAAGGTGEMFGIDTSTRINAAAARLRQRRGAALIAHARQGIRFVGRRPKGEKRRLAHSRCRGYSRMDRTRSDLRR